MPFKLHSKGRRHIPRQRYRVTNWREYDASLRNRGSLTIWFTPEAIAGWKAQPRTTPGGQRHYSDLAIKTALTLRTVFRLALRQSEGLIGARRVSIVRSDVCDRELLQLLFSEFHAVPPGAERPFFSDCFFCGGLAYVLRRRYSKIEPVDNVVIAPTISRYVGLKKFGNSGLS